MQNQKEYYIKDIATIKSGKRLPKGHSLIDDQTKYPYIKARDIRGGKIRQDQFQYLTEETQKIVKKYIVETNDVCITIVANIGDVGIVPEALNKVNLTENAVRLTKIRKDVSPQYLTHLLSAKFFKEHMELLASGAAQSKLGIYKIEKIKVQLPDYKTQHRIASILSAYDDLIEVNNQRIKLLEETARELYKEWFVRMRFPRYKEAKFVKGMPEGWDVKKLGDVIELAYGKELKAEDRKDGEYIVYGSSGIVGTHDSFIAKAPGIVIGRKGNVGSVFWVTKDFYPIDTAFYVKTKISLYYTYFNLQQQHFIEADAAVPGLSRNQAYSLFILIPDKSVIKEFDKIIKPIFEMVSNLDEQNTQLRQIRDRLLPRLISGKLEVK